MRFLWLSLTPLPEVREKYESSPPASGNCFSVRFVGRHQKSPFNVAVYCQRVVLHRRKDRLLLPLLLQRILQPSSPDSRHSPRSLVGTKSVEFAQTRFCIMLPLIVAIQPSFFAEVVRIPPSSSSSSYWVSPNENGLRRRTESNTSLVSGRTGDV